MGFDSNIANHGIKTSIFAIIMDKVQPRQKQLNMAEALQQMLAQLTVFKKMKCYGI